MTRLPDAVVTLNDEHRYMSLLLETLNEHVGNIRSASTGDYYLLQDIVRYMHDYPDVAHHPTEDLMFERLVKREPAFEENVARLRRDHTRLALETERIAELLDEAAGDRTAEAARAVQSAAREYIDSQRRHMQVEETTMFPAAVRCLTHADWKSIRERLEATDDPLFGESVRRDYRVLYEYFANRAKSMSQGLTRYGFVQLDGMIVSADALETGILEMWNMVQDHVEDVVRESRDTVSKTFDGRGLVAICALQSRHAAFLGRKFVEIGGDAAVIGLRTMRNAALPLIRGPA